MASTATPGARRRIAARVPLTGTDALLLLMALIWGVNYSIVKMATGWLPALAFNAVRVSLAAVVLLAIAAAIHAPWPNRSDLTRLAILGLLGNGLYQVLFIEGVARTRVATAALIFAAGPAFAALIARARGVEHVNRRGWIGIMLQLGGMVFVVIGGAQDPSTGTQGAIGVALVFLGALCWSFFSVAIAPLTHRVHPMRLTAVTMSAGAVLLLVTASRSIAQTAWTSAPPRAFAAIAYSGLAALVLAYVFWQRGLQKLGPTRTAMYGNVQPLIALAVAWITLGEVPTAWQSAGAVSIVSGLLWARA